MRRLTIMAAGLALAAGASLANYNAPQSGVSERAPMRAPAVPVHAIPAEQRRRKDPNDKKRRKPLKRQPLLSRLGLALPKYGKARPHSRVTNIRMAMKAGGRPVKVENPDKFLNSHARAMKALKMALAA